MKERRWMRGALVTAILLGAGRVDAVPCTIDAVPAATLLVPHFALDTTECGNPQTTTRVSVVNARTQAVLTHVTIWSNAGVAVAGFDLYLQGWDRQVIDLNDLICEGEVPSTGPTTSPSGDFTSSPVSFPGCSDPVAAPLTGNEIVSLRAYLNGDTSPATGLCAGWPTGRAEGYVTIDVVDACGLLSPADPQYYFGHLGFDNALVGEYEIVDPLNNFAVGFEAVHVEADLSVFAAPGIPTFYGRYNGTLALDAREPLGTAYRVPYDLTAEVTAGTDLTVWRETDGDGAPFSCFLVPDFYPLTHRSLLAFPDEDTAQLGGTPLHGSLPLATQRVALQGPDLRLHPSHDETGWIHLNLQHPVPPYDGSLRVGQAWVSSTRSWQGRFATGLHAVQLDNACFPAGFAYQTPGRAPLSAIPGPP